MTGLYLIGLLLAAPAAPDDLYRRGGWGSLASDQRAAGVGDALTVIVYQAADASNTAQKRTSKATESSAGLDVGGGGADARMTLGGGYTARGEARRSERLATQLSVVVTEMLDNGDLLVAGRQRMQVNGEQTMVSVRGRIRLADISAENTVLSTRIADAQIDYDGRGFVSRGTRPGLIHRLFGLLGLS